LLKDKVAVVSGVGPGLGRSAALAFAREGAAVGLAARTDATLQGVADEIEALGGRAVPVATDITDVDDCRRAVATTVEELGGLDVLVNSAFRPSSFEPFETGDLAQWREVYDVNVFGSLQLTQAAVPYLKSRGGGSIVFVNTMETRKVRHGSGDYGSSKGALLVAAQVLAKELGPYQIRVNSVVPGWIWGPNVQMYVEWQATERGVTTDEIVAEITQNIPLGSIPPSDDVANAIVFFASDLSRCITGQTLDVNGGEWFH
jgi:NAD(P)-dependent dehydrogenase (short-subunit alcohol dehydrogenase family)